MIKIYTDGAAQGNPGPGGYGVIMKYGSHVKELSQGFRRTTNNRMELLAVIAGLEAIKKDGIPVTIYSDSEYVVNAVEKGWIWNWEKQNFKKKANVDLWQRYIPKSSNQNLYGYAGTPDTQKMNDAITWQ
jgi:ribonuclease HI